MKPVIWVLSRAEADDLNRLGASLEPWLRGSPADTALCRLDEQQTAQSRDMYEEATDELREGLYMLLSEDQYQSASIDVLARAIVDRVLGIYEPLTTAPEKKEPRA